MQYHKTVTYCFFNVPEYEFGLPKYDLKECCVYLFIALMRNGFHVKYTSPGLLYISWAHFRKDSEICIKVVEDALKTMIEGESTEKTTTTTNGNHTGNTRSLRIGKMGGDTGITGNKSQYI